MNRVAVSVDVANVHRLVAGQRITEIRWYPEPAKAAWGEPSDRYMAVLTLAVDEDDE